MWFVVVAVFLVGVWFLGRRNRLKSNQRAYRMGRDDERAAMADRFERTPEGTMYLWAKSVQGAPAYGGQRDLSNFAPSGTKMEVYMYLNGAQYAQVFDAVLIGPTSGMIQLTRPHGSWVPPPNGPIDARLTLRIVDPWP